MISHSERNDKLRLKERHFYLLRFWYYLIESAEIHSSREQRLDDHHPGRAEDRNRAKDMLQARAAILFSMIYV